MMQNFVTRWFLTVRHRWHQLRSSFWFVPAIIVLGAIGLAAAMIGVDATVDLHVVRRWPLLFGAGAAGSRGLLTAVASSMITVAGVVFSITIVALSLTSSQYTSRVLRNFMRDSVNQSVLGVFVGIFAYCLVVLRTIRGGDEGAFVPSLAVMVGLLLGFLGIGFLIYFIHHIAVSIQASSIIAAAAAETLAAIDHLFPKGVGKGAEEPAVDRQAIEDEHNWVAVPALQSGYLEAVDGKSLLTLAADRKTIFRMERGIGEFVIEDAPLLSIADAEQLEKDDIEALNAIYLLSRQRTVQQDAGFGIRQIVDIALKALSPGVNDTTTAVMCLDYLAAILVRLASRDIPSAYRYEGGQLLIIARGPTFESLLAEALDQIRHNAEGNVVVLTRLIEALESIAGATDHEQRVQSVREQADLVAAFAARTVAPLEAGAINAAVVRLNRALARRLAPQPS